MVATATTDKDLSKGVPVGSEFEWPVRVFPSIWESYDVAMKKSELIRGVCSGLDYAGTLRITVSARFPV